MTRALLAGLALLALSACRDEAALRPLPVAMTPAAVGHYCQMNLFDHPGPKAQVHLEGLPDPLFFSQVRDAIAYQRMPEQSHAITKIHVSDMGAAPGWDDPGAENWIAAAVHSATGGAFDPTIQPLWAAYAEAHAQGAAPTEEALAEALSRTGWSAVSVSSARIGFDRPGMALTLNGIAQGYIADRVARLFEAEGLGNILIDTGELRALGGSPQGGDWPVTLASGGTVALRDRALATSAPGGTTFDSAGRVGHMIDPRTGRPARVSGRSVSVSAPTAALADALSTAACILDEPQRIDAALGAFRDCRRV